MAKKLTKAQVKRILKNIANNYQRLFNDKYTHTTASHVPFGAQKLANTLFAARTEANKVK